MSTGLDEPPRFDRRCGRCPECGSGWVDLVTAATREYFHQCNRCRVRWGHACWHCHDDPPPLHRCPRCGRKGVVAR